MQRRYLFTVLFIILLSISLGYALLTTNLNIVGTTIVKDNKWDIYFDNVQVFHYVLKTNSQAYKVNHQNQ